MKIKNYKDELRNLLLEYDICDNCISSINNITSNININIDNVCIVDIFNIYSEISNIYIDTTNENLKINIANCFEFEELKIHLTNFKSSYEEFLKLSEEFPFSIKTGSIKDTVTWIDNLLKRDEESIHKFSTFILRIYHDNKSYENQSILKPIYQMCIKAKYVIFDYMNNLELKEDK